MFPEGRFFEFLIAGAVALIVLGPKDLPIFMRKVGQFLARMRAMAAEFRASFDELARQSELDELRREVEALKSGRTVETTLTGGAAGEVDAVMAEIHAGLEAGGAQLHPPMGSPAPAPADQPPPAATKVEAESQPVPAGRVETGS